MLHLKILKRSPDIVLGFVFYIPIMFKADLSAECTSLKIESLLYYTGFTSNFDVRFQFQLKLVEK